MTTKTVHAPATAKDVRAFFAEFPTLVPEAAAHTVDRSAKGRIHPQAREVFNECSGRTYSEGTPRTVALPHFKISKTGARLKRTSHVPVSEVRALVGKGNIRGPLSKAELSLASEKYTEIVNKD